MTQVYDFSIQLRLLLKDSMNKTRKPKCATEIFPVCIKEGAYVCTPSLFLYPKEKLHLGSLSIVDVDKHDS